MDLYIRFLGSVVNVPFLKGIIVKLESLQSEGHTPTSISARQKGEVKNLIVTLKMLNATTKDLEEMVFNSHQALDVLLHFQALLYDVDDLIDTVMITNRSDQTPLLPNKVSSAISRLTGTTIPQISKSYPTFGSVLQALYDLLDRVDRVMAARLNPRYDDDRRPPAEVYLHRPFLRENIVERRREEEAVINLLLKSDERVSVVPVVGSLGVGKTTLARLVFDNQKILDTFNHRFWVSIGDSLDSFEFWKRVCRELGLDWLPGDDCDTKPIKMVIREFMRGKRVLAVLDDFRDNIKHRSIATELIDVMSNDHGSAIVVATSFRRAASSIGTTPPYQLQPLPPKACYHLLIRRISSHLSVQDSTEFQTLVEDSVNLSGGVPLLLEFLASVLLLIDRQSSRWLPRQMRYYLASYGEVYVEKENLLIQVLGNALDDFPPHLKIPLEIIVRLQKACGLDVEAVIGVWMALGLLYSADNDTTEPPECIGRKYLRQLGESAFGSQVQYAPGGVIRHINFNPALYIFTTVRRHPSWFTIGEDRKLLVWLPLYLIRDKSCLSSSLLPSQSVSAPAKVRLFMSGTGQCATIELIKDVLSHFPFLRVLGIAGCDAEMLPDSIGELKCLRYLDVGGSPRMTGLPKSICDLWRLQTLFLHGCSQLEDLPKNIGRLKNLRYLTLTILAGSLPEAIGQLTSLRSFGLSSCPNLASLPSTIKNLKKLETLAIVKCPELDVQSTSSVEGLKGMDSMHTLLLSRIPKFASLPELGSSSTALKHLQILNCTGLTERTWVAQFKSLRSLTIEDCPNLLDLQFAKGAPPLLGVLELVIRRCPLMESTAWIRQFVSTRSLIIDDCPKVAELDAGFAELKKLQRMEIRCCPLLTEWFESPAGKEWRQKAYGGPIVGME